MGLKELDPQHTWGLSVTQSASSFLDTWSNRLVLNNIFDISAHSASAHGHAVKDSHAGLALPYRHKVCGEEDA